MLFVGVLVQEERREGKTIYICECGLGYGDMLIAYACEEYRRVHGVNSGDIIKHAIYNPRSDPRTKVAPKH
jgi:hypothetical protein